MKKYNSTRPHPVNKEFGALVRIKRQEKELNQQDLADKLGVSYQQLQKYELGTNRITLVNAFKFKDLLDISFKEFEEAYITGEAKADGK